MEQRTTIPHLAPETTEAVDAAAERPFGPAAAVLLATGIGAVVLGLLTTLNEASESINSFLRFSDAVGPLSGKTVFGSGAFLVSWAILHGLWREKAPPVRAVVIATAVLLALGLLGTFPPFFEAFASD
jgi:hypothetical protein